MHTHSFRSMFKTQRGKWKYFTVCVCFAFQITTIISIKVLKQPPSSISKTGIQMYPIICDNLKDEKQLHD